MNLLIFGHRLFDIVPSLGGGGGNRTLVRRMFFYSRIVGNNKSFKKVVLGGMRLG